MTATAAHAPSKPLTHPIGPQRSSITPGAVTDILGYPDKTLEEPPKSSAVFPGRD
jgi:hypothetical protein